MHFLPITPLWNSCKFITRIEWYNIILYLSFYRNTEYNIYLPSSGTVGNRWIYTITLWTLVEGGGGVLSAHWYEKSKRPVNASILFTSMVNEIQVISVFFLSVCFLS